jgi:hypothetical protein
MRITQRQADQLTGKIGVYSNKYGSIKKWHCLKCEIDVVKQKGQKPRCPNCKNIAQHFASMAEYNRYRELRLLEKFGDISDLECQPIYDLFINGMKVTRYVGDFKYKDSTGKEIVEDVKGVMTKLFVIKSKLMQAIHGIKILIT